MNLKRGGGKVPIINSTEHEATPYLFLDFPIGEEFDSLYSKAVPKSSRDKYYLILRNRSMGMTLEESGKMFGVTRERVRQIEAKFLRLMREKYFRDMNSSLLKLASKPTESFLDSVTL